VFPVRYGLKSYIIFIRMSVKQICNIFKQSNSHIGTNIRVRIFNAELLARSQFASGRSCDRPTRSRFSVAFLGPRANAELVPKFHVALHASHAALPLVTSKFRPTVGLQMLDQNFCIRQALPM
jgi:hypothetical protein